IALQIANHSHQNVINPEHLFIACVAYQRGPHLGETLRPLGLDAAQLKQHLASLHASKTPYRKGNPLNSLTQQSEKAIEAAHAAMRANFSGRISTSHLLLGLLSDENFASVTMLQDIGADLEALKCRARETIVSDGQIATPQKKFSPGAKRALERAAREAKAANHHFIGTDHLLLALLPQRETWRGKLKAGGQSFDSVEGLWTAEQVAALKGEFEKASNSLTEKIVELAPRPASKLKQWLDIIPFNLGFVGGSFLFHLPQNKRAETFFIVVTMSFFVAILVSGIGTCVTIVRKSAPHIKEAWMGFFAKTVAGLFLGYYLWRFVGNL
ncbi:MAG TPA: Clp protease N-terminal domain-containing protein, partial [Abditibacterium sp.]